MTKDEIAAARALIAAATPSKPRVVCLCGSTRFFRSFMEWYGRLTDEGCIVLTIGRIVGQSEGALGEARKVALDELHKRKIDLADEVFVLDVGGYTGTSTKGEIAHAEATGKPVRYLSREFPEYVEPEVPEFVRSMIERDRRAALDRAEALSAENERLRAALKPFAAIGAVFNRPGYADIDDARLEWGCRLSSATDEDLKLIVGDFRAAAKACGGDR